MAQDLTTQRFNGGEQFEWLPDGNVKPKDNFSSLSKEQAQGALHAGAAIPYKGIWDPNLQMWDTCGGELEGLTNFEAMVTRLMNMAANGDKKAMEMVMDRLIGKPMQSIETKVGIVCLGDRLDAIRKRNEPIFEQLPYINIQPNRLGADLGI